MYDKSQYHYWRVNADYRSDGDNAYIVVARTKVEAKYFFKSHYPWLQVRSVKLWDDEYSGEWTLGHNGTWILGEKEQLK